MSFPWSPLQVLYKAIYGFPREAEPAPEPLNLTALAVRIAETAVEDLHQAHHRGDLEVWDHLHQAPKGDLPADLYITAYGRRVICHAALHELERVFGRRA